MITALMGALLQTVVETAPGEAASVTSLVVKPIWDRRPAFDDQMRVYPKAAADAFLVGTARIACTVTEAGSLADCVVDGEEPAGAGFGASAVSLADRFRMRPVDRDGAPVAGRRLYLPIRFVRPVDIRSAPLTYVTSTIAGHVELDCRYEDRKLDNCRAIGAVSAGVEAEARRLAAEMTLPELPRPRGRIAIPFHFQSQDASRPSEASVVPPEWLRRPTGDDVARVYPRRALRRGLSGAVVTSCSVTKQGTLAECRTVDEYPTGEGFGDAALKLMPLFLMRLATRDGQPVEGGTVRIPIRFVLPR